MFDGVLKMSLKVILVVNPVDTYKFKVSKTILY